MTLKLYVGSALLLIGTAVLAYGVTTIGHSHTDIALLPLAFLGFVVFTLGVWMALDGLRAPRRNRGPRNE